MFFQVRSLAKYAAHQAQLLEDFLQPSRQNTEILTRFKSHHRCASLPPEDYQRFSSLSDGKYDRKQHSRWASLPPEDYHRSTLSKSPPPRSRTRDRQYAHTRSASPIQAQRTLVPRLDLEQMVQINSEKATNTHASKQISKFHKWMDGHSRSKRGSIHPARVDAVATGSLGFIKGQTEKGLEGADGQDDRTGFSARTSSTRQIFQISWAGREWIRKGEGNGEGNSLNRGHRVGSAPLHPLSVDSPPATGRSELGVREQPAPLRVPPFGRKGVELETRLMTGKPVKTWLDKVGTLQRMRARCVCAVCAGDSIQLNDHQDARLFSLNYRETLCAHAAVGSIQQRQNTVHAQTQTHKPMYDHILEQRAASSSAVYPADTKHELVALSRAEALSQKYTAGVWRLVDAPH